MFDLTIAAGVLAIPVVLLLVGLYVKRHDPWLSESEHLESIGSHKANEQER